ncbi:Homologous-pairing protein 2 [Sesamum angolense]|uniref:Homologous-pairing protein 2 homolog n=1 Tax=Sesamum angolense TaxID=2727404 RepID=A0AAE1WUT6_9LAMI|nr:Homologous-pairing protein 2 [Sesamum angolense]
MAPRSDSAEGIVLNFVNEQNRPLNSQCVADSLQKFSLKKAAVQKALDSLADSGKISFKEYGKQKLYLARQDQFNIPNNEELNQMKEENAKLQEQLNEQKKAIAEVEGEIKALQSNLTLEDIHAKRNKLGNEVKQMEEKLIKLRQGVTLEELGIEYDEDVGVSLQSHGELMQSGKKRARCK